MWLRRMRRSILRDTLHAVCRIGVAQCRLGACHARLSSAGRSTASLASCKSEAYHARVCKNKARKLLCQATFPEHQVDPAIVCRLGASHGIEPITHTRSPRSQQSLPRCKATRALSDERRSVGVLIQRHVCSRQDFFFFTVGTWSAPQPLFTIG